MRHAGEMFATFYSFRVVLSRARGRRAQNDRLKRGRGESCFRNAGDAAAKKHGWTAAFA